MEIHSVVNAWPRASGRRAVPEWSVEVGRGGDSEASDESVASKQTRRRVRESRMWGWLSDPGPISVRRGSACPRIPVGVGFGVGGRPLRGGRLEVVRLDSSERGLRRGKPVSRAVCFESDVSDIKLYFMM
jgi:uncharacterized membrane-anchored protein